MDPRTFDTLTGRLASIRTRRRAVASLTGVVSALLLGASMAAACKEVGQNCDQNNDCCQGAKCRNGECQCAARSSRAAMSPAFSPACGMSKCRGSRSAFSLGMTGPTPPCVDSDEGDVHERAHR